MTISYLSDALLPVKHKNTENLKQLIQEKKVKPLVDAKLLEIWEKFVSVEAHRQEEKIPNDYLFVFIGGIPPFQMLKNAGITFGSGEKKETRVDQPSISRAVSRVW